MNILDTNGISHIFTNNITPQEDYYLVPDVVEEVELTQMVHGRRTPDNIFPITKVDAFEQAVYLNHYKNTLNKYGGRSFYNMTGFGDVSVIATIYTIIDSFEKRKMEQLFDNSEQIVVYTGDVRLTANIQADFVGKDVVVRPVADIS